MNVALPLFLLNQNSCNSQVREVKIGYFSVCVCVCVYLRVYIYIYIYINTHFLASQGGLVTALSYKWSRPHTKSSFWTADGVVGTSFPMTEAVLFLTCRFVG